MIENPPKSATIEEIFRLTADLKPEYEGDLERLRSLLLTASSSPGDEVEVEMPRRLERLELDQEVLRTIPEFKLDSHDLKNPPLHIVRRDEREDLLALRLADPLTALGGIERIGPFLVDDRKVFFEFWREARRFEITENGASKPALVISSARLPKISLLGSTTLDLQKGTIWIRGDLLDAGLPAGAYVGITVSDGKLRLPNVTGSAEDSVEVLSPLEARLELVLTADELTPGPDGCISGASLDLPRLTLVFGADGLEIEGAEGRAEVWGQEFQFPGTTGRITFVPQLWCLLLDYKFDPDVLDATQIKSNLADFGGNAKIKEASLALPVVVAEPAALGPAALSPGFWMSLQEVTSRWYEPDERFHSLDPWISINNRAVALLDINAAALSTPVKTTFSLWELPNSEGKRLPWRHDYSDSFIFYHVCDIKSGESLVANAQTHVALDRPVQANGRPVPTPTDLGGRRRQGQRGDSTCLTKRACLGDSGSYSVRRGETTGSAIH